MNDIDELVRRSLRHSEMSSPDDWQLDRILDAGHSRKRRRAAAFGAAGAGVVLLAALSSVVLTDRTDESIRTDNPTSPAPTVVATTTTVATPPDNNAASTVVQTAPPATSPASVAPAPAAVTTAPPPPSDAPARQAATISAGSRTVTLDVVGRAPERDQAFMVTREQDDTYGSEGPWPTEVWSLDGNAATITVECDSPVGCIPRVAYDGRYAWVALQALRADFDAPPTEYARLVRADLVDGTVIEVPVGSTGWTAGENGLAEGIALAVLDVAGNGDGSASVVTVTTYGSQTEPDKVINGVISVAYVDVTGTTTGTQGFTAVIDPPVTDPRFSAALGGDGKLAYSWSSPRDGARSVHVIDLESGVDTALDPIGEPIDVYVSGWSPDGERLLLEDRWEGVYSYEVFAENGRETRPVGEWPSWSNACYLPNGELAVGRWEFPGAETNGEPGTIEVLSADRGEARDLGVDFVGEAMTCLAEGRMVVAEGSALWLVEPNGDAMQIASGKDLQGPWL
jgi:hypothetical protein